MPLIRLKRVKPLEPKTSTPQKTKENTRIATLELNETASVSTMANMDTRFEDDNKRASTRNLRVFDEVLDEIISEPIG